MRAACHRCGGDKEGPFVPCKSCGFVPQGEERPTAWLFSLHNLSEEDLSLAVERVRQGERPDPGRALRASAKKEMGAIPVTESNQVPLPTPHLVGIAAANLLLTPLLKLCASHYPSRSPWAHCGWAWWPCGCSASPPR